MNLISCLSLNCSVLSHDWEVIVVRLREERKESTAMQGSKEPYDISAAEDGNIEARPREEQQEIDVDRMRDDVKTEALAAGWFAGDCTEIRDDGFECFT